MGLLPTFTIPTPTTAVPTPRPANYPKSPLFDFDQGDFVRAAGKVPLADGHRAWVQWCVKAVLTARNAHAIYSSNYGSELDRVILQPNLPLAQAQVAATITDTLMADPRTLNVSGFAFAQAGDELQVSFLVTPVVGPPTRLNVSLAGG